MSETFKQGKGPKLGTGLSTMVNQEESSAWMGFVIPVIIIIIFLVRWLSSDQPAPKKSAAKRRARPREPHNSIEEVQQALRKSGLEACDLIVAIDFTKSNSWNGANSFNGRNLHDVSSDVQNPYQRVMSVICTTLSAFDDDHLIPAFGFGDVYTKAESVFSFFPDERPCLGLEEVMQRYNQIVSDISMSGPTSFAPAIRKAIEVVKQTKSFHVLLIIADGQVDRKEETIKAIVEASEYPLAIVCIGVGDGPWEAMIEMDDEIPERAFDNFQFVDFHDIESSANIASRPFETEFATAALMELPAQYCHLRKNGKI